MRSHEERVAAVKQRVSQIEKQNRQRRNRIAVLASAAACLAVIIAASFVMPGLSEKLISGDYTKYEAAASIFSGSAAAGSIIIGLLAFVLGVGVTILCFKLKVLWQEDEESEDNDDRVH